MLYAALMWQPEAERYPLEFVLAHPEVVRFHEGWGRAGDVALIAEAEGHPVGCVWYRLFTDGDHGAGYVDDETPELAIAVADDHRGKGVGATLLDAAAERARRDGLARLSLSVDEGNPAKHLVREVGLDRVRARGRQRQDAAHLRLVKATLFTDGGARGNPRAGRVRLRARGRRRDACSRRTASESASRRTTSPSIAR